MKHSVAYRARRRRMRYARKMRDVNRRLDAWGAQMRAEREALVSAAAEASEIFGDDELERYAAERRAR